MDNKTELELRDRIAQLESQVAAGLPPNSWTIPTAKKQPSGKTVTVKSHSGGGVGFGGREYKPGRDGLIRNLPIEAVWEVEGATYWRNGTEPFKVQLEIIEEVTK
jgi:hypothetical protein